MLPQNTIGIDCILFLKKQTAFAQLGLFFKTGYAYALLVACHPSAVIRTTTSFASSAALV